MTYDHLPFIPVSDYKAHDGLKLVPVDFLPEAQKRFAEMAKRCMTRLKGIAPPTFTVIARGTYRHSWELTNGDGEKFIRSADYPAVWVRVDGEQPKLAGWSLAARLQRLATGERMTRNVPGVELPERFRDTGWTCEHCNSQRDRKDCFVVKDEAGNFKQVGASCLKDFLGHNPAAMLKFFSSFGGLCDEFGEFLGGYRLPMCHDTVELLQWACAAIRVFGWMGAAAARAYNEKCPDDAAGKIPTVEYVRACYGAGESAHKMRKALEPTETDIALAAATLAWVRGWTMKQMSDYESNLSIALKHDAIDPRTMGIAVSAPSAFLRASNRAAELQLKREQAGVLPSSHRGAEKERLRNIPVTVAYMRYIESDFGGSTLVKFTADNGDVLTWFASGRFDGKPGDKGQLTGTVKRHSEYNGVKETQVSRCVFSVATKAAA